MRPARSKGTSGIAKMRRTSIASSATSIRSLSQKRRAEMRRGLIAGRADSIGRRRSARAPRKRRAGAPRRVRAATVPRLLRHVLTGRGWRDVLHAHDLDRIEIACDRPLPLQADGEDLGDVEHAVFEAERGAIAVLV